MKKNSMAEITQFEAQDDAALLTQMQNKITDYIAEKGMATLFKDGSMLEPTDEYGAGNISINPKKEIEVALDEVYKNFNANEDGYVLTIKDQAGSDVIEHINHYNIRVLSLSEEGTGFLYETDEAGESMARHLNKDELISHMEDLGYNEDGIKKLSSVVKEKNDELRNKSIFSFLKEKLGLGGTPKPEVRNKKTRKLR